MGKPTEVADARSKQVWAAVCAAVDVPIEDMGLVDRGRLVDALNMLNLYLDVRFIARLRDHV